MSINYLALLNKHLRDKNITFKDEGHIYTINGKSNFTSVTTFIHTLFEGFDADKIINNMMRSKNWPNNKYCGLSKTEIKQMWKDNGKVAANAGTKLHYDIECKYNNMSVTNNSMEYQHFLCFYNDYLYLKPYRTEWLIYHDDLRFAGSIDMVFMNSEGVLEIYDWKRVKDIQKNNKWNKWLLNDAVAHLPDTNYWHYALQLNIYKAILIEKYGMNVGNLYLVSLHPDNNSYIRILVADLQEEVRELFDVYMRDDKGKK